MEGFSCSALAAKVKAEERTTHPILFLPLQGCTVLRPLPGILGELDGSLGRRGASSRGKQGVLQGRGEMPSYWGLGSGQLLVPLLSALELVLI